MSSCRGRLRCPLVVVSCEDEAWAVASQHPALAHTGKFGLSVYARVLRCRRYGGHVVLYNEMDGECGIFIVGKVSRSSIEWIVPIAGLIGYDSVTFITDRPALERLAEYLGYEKDLDGFMSVGVF